MRSSSTVKAAPAYSSRSTDVKTSGYPFDYILLFFSYKWTVVGAQESGDERVYVIVRCLVNSSLMRMPMLSAKRLQTIDFFAHSNSTSSALMPLSSRAVLLNSAKGNHAGTNRTSACPVNSNVAALRQNDPLTYREVVHHEQARKSFSLERCEGGFRVLDEKIIVS